MLIPLAVGVLPRFELPQQRVGAFHARRPLRHHQSQVGHQQGDVRFGGLNHTGSGRQRRSLQRPVHLGRRHAPDAAGLQQRADRRA